MRLRLTPSQGDGPLAGFSAELPAQEEAVDVCYRTRTGALLRVDGVAAGAFDREHRAVTLAPSNAPRRLELQVERHALPTNGLPSGPGVVWRWLNARSHPAAQTSLDVKAAPAQTARAAPRDGLPLIGHSHLDVAWLWTYAETARKAERTFATACALLDRQPSFLFAQSQPQLYDFVEECDPALFERVREYVRAGRWDANVAALWVESDCNIPSGESLLRQMLHAYRYCRSRFGVTPSIAWLPDSFGFCNTLPQLLAHCGIPYFATTKLQWNDTTKFPYPQFVWEAPDGSSVVSAMLQGYDGPAWPWRVATAKARNEPLVLGYGDGGGGVTEAMVERSFSLGTWIRPETWFEELASRRTSLPVHRDELYLEFHRGVYTTHHDIKAQNALLERALLEAEELAAWCVAVHAPPAAIAQFAERLERAWEIVLRNQFHDVLPGTAIAPVYADALSEYAQAGELVASVMSAAQTILPRASRPAAGIERCEPVADGDAMIFDNGLLRARVERTGALTELSVPGGRNLCAQANLLALYRDVPKQWEAWNLDASYARRMRRAAVQDSRVEDGALAVTFACGASPARMRVALFAGEPFLRVDLDVDWHERRTLLRVENWFTVQTERATYGTAHGTIERSALAQTPQERAKYEVPGQRFAAVRDDAGDGAALFALDTYGWSARALARGGIRVGHSLLRGTSWPDPGADLGEQHFAYAFVPFAGARTGALERAWLRFAHEPRVRLFSCEDDAVLVVACKPAGERSVVVRVRECDGAARTVRLRCAARFAAVSAVDGLEREVDAPVHTEGEHLIFDLPAYGLRSFEARFADA